MGRRSAFSLWCRGCVFRSFPRSLAAFSLSSTAVQGLPEVCSGHFALLTEARRETPKASDVHGQGGDDRREMPRGMPCGIIVGSKNSLRPHLGAPMGEVSALPKAEPAPHCATREKKDRGRGVPPRHSCVLNRDVFPGPACPGGALGCFRWMMSRGRASRNMHARMLRARVLTCFGSVEKASRVACHMCWDRRPCVQYATPHLQNITPQETGASASACTAAVMSPTSQ